MKIIHIASEMTPYAKTGGLGDVIGSLSQALQGLGHDVSVFLPRYKCVDSQKWKLQVAIKSLKVEVGNQKEKGRLLFKKLSTGVTLYFVEHEEFFLRPELYGTPLGDYPDNDRRFTYFQRAALQSITELGIKPDILHCHDWQTGLIPVYLKTLEAKNKNFKRTKTIFTIHNLAYQGNFPPDSLAITGLKWKLFKPEMLEFYGKVSFLKGGLVFSDRITTVSDRYSEEIQSQEFGCGLEGILQARKKDLFGVVNGIDYKEWNPKKDPDIKATYDGKNWEGKRVNKKALQKENNFKEDPQTPLIGMVSRLVDQKGLDILIPALERLAKLGIQFVLLGAGEEKYHKMLRAIAKKNQKGLSIRILFDPKMAKRIYAGCDMFIVPSYYEPCGLGQMISLKYGTIPIVRATGGLADTIQEFDPKTGKGNGFLFRKYTSEAFLEALTGAVKIFQDEKLWGKLMSNAMRSDFSWKASAKKYVQLYETVKRRTIKIGKS